MKNRKLLWACRRGMLEIDLILQPFVQLHYDQMNEKLQKSFQNLLETEDPNLYAWLMGYEPIPFEHQIIIDYIKEKHAQNTRHHA